MSFQFRDIRAKAASDLEDLAHAQKLLVHKRRATTEHYAGRRKGERVSPVSRDSKVMTRAAGRRGYSLPLNMRPRWRLQALGFVSLACQGSYGVKSSLALVARDIPVIEQRLDKFE